ncbi:relaxase/mobilization nuclease domain-containing protein [Rhodobacter maris]|uniref:Toprim domain-containing protein n=1 Tax=Rhodobacter maris TaxID=446682 RepID=A0A285RM91_9RHOB|nr:relaxase/mobilization nuclease domain-containing protein [Rhodobacter maris]SOB95226.1 Toprim domain-containing protein [Rhodobacter maris]
MICKVIAREGELGSGGGREAFLPGIRYVCEKGSSIAIRNLSCRSWTDAAEEMNLTSQLSNRVQNPYYHIVISWHEIERPTEAQQIAAMARMLRALGLHEHQAVIATHDDTPRRHVHAVINTVHPLTGRAWSKSNDRRRAEQACRQIELEMGWPHDRGQYDFVVQEIRGRKIVKLVARQEEHYQEIKMARENGRRKKTSAQIKVEKKTGIEVFDHAIPDALKIKLWKALDTCRTWQDVHTVFHDLGLRYDRFGSGARVYLVGSTEFVKASSFGARLSISRMEKLFGAFKPAEAMPKRNPGSDLSSTCGLIGQVAPEDEKATRATAFKTTLLRRIYIEIHIDSRVAREIRFVDLAALPPQITFRSGAVVMDHGARLSTTASSHETRATMIAMAKAKRWSSVTPTGSADYVRQISVEAAQAGLRVTGVPADIQAEADRIFEAQRQKRRLDAAEHAAQRAHLEEMTEREYALQRNSRFRMEVAAEKRAMDDGRDHEPSPPLDARHVPEPQPAPDAARHALAKIRNIRKTVRDNDRDELEHLKRLDIGVIAAAGGWADVSRTHRDSSDKEGRAFRIYQRGGDTIKCTLKPDGRWLWVSNKTGDSGTIFDLWRRDNPGRTLGHARAALRDLAGTAPVVVEAAPTGRSPTPPDHTEVRRRWEAAGLVGQSTSYAEKRGISKATLRRFADALRCGAFGGIYFAHRNLATGDIQGFEQRWERDGEKNQARFAKGGRKSVCILGDPSMSRRMVVLEGGLDALALAEIENRHDTIYVSTGGGFGPETERALMHLAAGRETLGGFDNDRAGEAMHAALAKIVTGTNRLAPPSRVSGADVNCKDWLDVLNARKEASAAHWIGVERAAETNREIDNGVLLRSEDDRTTPDFD